MVLAKLHIVSNKNSSITLHLCIEMAGFGQKSVLFLPSGFSDRFHTQEQSMLFIPT
jgi:hypothetical protein